METETRLILTVLRLFRDYIHAVLLWTELQPPATVLLIFVLLYTLVSLPVVWGYIVINLACGYLYGVAHGIAVTVVTATIGVTIAHVLCKVISITYHSHRNNVTVCRSMCCRGTSRPSCTSPSTSAPCTPSSRASRHSGWCCSPGSHPSHSGSRTQSSRSQGEQSEHLEVYGTTLVKCVPLVAA